VTTAEAIARLVARLVQPLQRRVLLMIGRAVIEAVNDGAKVQVLGLTALKDEVLGGAERFQEYGFTSVPHPGAEAILLAVGGNRDHPIVVAVEDRRYRLTGLAGGEMAIHDDLGQKVHLKRNGIHGYSPLNILFQTNGVLRLEGDGVEIHGRTYVQTDVHGKGQRETWTGGVDYHTDSYVDGVGLATSTEHGLDQPAVPSDHPDVEGA